MSMIDQDFVRDIIERHSDALGGNGRDFHNGAYVAIANELNSTLSSCNCSNSERTNEPRLPHFWTHDGTLHVELPKLPESISVRLPDARDREVGSARVWQYTRDRGTCYDIWDTELTGRLRFQCSECGAVSLEITPNFCPVCGRRIEVNDG